MLRTITGNPGSGKSFYAMNYLKKFVDYDSLYHTLLLSSDVWLITNIDGIRVNYTPVQEWIDKFNYDIDLIRDFMFSHGYKRAILIVDECQRIYGNEKSNNVLFFFEYHRHLGFDVFLICQTVSALPKRLVELSENIIDALPRSYSLGSFRYEVKDPVKGFRLYSISIRPNHSVFRLYQSFVVDEASKPKKVLLRRYMIGFLISGSMLLLVFFYAHNGFGFSKRVIDKPKDKSYKSSPFIKSDNVISSIKECPHEKTISHTSKSTTYSESNIAPRGYFSVSGADFTTRSGDRNLAGVAVVGDTTYYFPR